MIDRDLKRRQARRAGRPRLRPSVEGLEGRALMSYGGTFDFNFGTDGFVPYTAPPTSGSSHFNNQFDPFAEAIQPDGKLLIAGREDYFATYSGDGIAVARYNADGTIDTTFGTGGYFSSTALAVPFGGGGSDSINGASAIALQPDGKIVVVGDLDPSGVAVRLNADGTLDTSFGTGGVVTFGAYTGDTLASVPTVIESVNTVQVLPGGQIAVGGAVVTGGVQEPAVEMLNADGSIHTSYGFGGLAAIPAPNGVQWASSVTTSAGITAGGLEAMGLEPNGEVVIEGKTSSTSAPAVFAEINTGGTLDTTFGTGGEERVPTLFPNSTDEDVIGPLAIQADGKIVIGASGPNTGTLAIRLNTDGTPDTSFGVGGYDDIIGPSVDSSEGTPAYVSIQPDGKILISASSSYPTLIRLDADGLPDLTFGEGGIAGLLIQVGADQYVAPYQAFTLSDGNIELATDNGIDVLLGQGSQGDYNNDGTSDPAVYDTTTATFSDAPSGGGTPASTVIGDAGAGLTLPAPGAYGGGGITEVAVYRPGSATFDILPYRGGIGFSEQIISFGMPGIGNTLPAPGDYNRSGKTELAAYFPSLGEFIYRPAQGGPDVAVPMGIAGAGQSIPAPADYFGTGQTDFALYLTGLGAYEVRNPTTGEVYTIPFGTPGAGNSIPLLGDYDGSGHDELAVYLPASGDLIYRPANGGADVTIPIGTPGVAASIPEIGDFDGSGHDEAAVYNPATATFVYQPAGGDSPVSIPLGTAGETVPFSLGTDSVAEEGTGAPSGSAGALNLPATVPVPLTQDVLDTLDGLNLKKKAGQA